MIKISDLLKESSDHGRFAQEAGADGFDNREFSVNEENPSEQVPDEKRTLQQFLKWSILRYYKETNPETQNSLMVVIKLLKTELGL